MSTNNNTQKMSVVTLQDAKNILAKSEEKNAAATSNEVNPTEEIKPFEIKVSNLSHNSNIGVIPGKLINLRQTLEALTRSSDLLSEKSRKIVNDLLKFFENPKTIYFNTSDVVYIFDEKIMSSHFLGRGKLPSDANPLKLNGLELIDFLHSLRDILDTMDIIRSIIIPESASNDNDNEDPLTMYCFVPVASKEYQSLTDDEKTHVEGLKKAMQAA